MKLFKLTDENQRTTNTQWGENVTHNGLGWIHVYEHPLLAVLHNPIHADFKNPLLWEAETTDENPKRDGQLKIGVRNLTTIRQIPLPEITLIQKVAYGIYVAKEVYTNEIFQKWADAWLSGEDRSYMAVIVAWRLVEEAVMAANAAWRLAEAAMAANAAWRSAEAEAMTAAAWRLATTAETAAGKSLDFVACVEKAMKIK